MVGKRASADGRAASQACILCCVLQVAWQCAASWQCLPAMNVLSESMLLWIFLLE